MKLEFRAVNRDNFRAMLALKVHPGQERFVASPGKSLAGCYVRAFGDEFEHLPHLIFDGEVAVGYVTIVSNPTSRDEYWIDDILIDADYQGKGYGRAATAMALRLILTRYPQCESIRLTCYVGNDVAAHVYESLGFRKNGRLHEEFREPEYELIAPALDQYRPV